MQRPYLFILARKYFFLFTIWLQRILVYRARVILYFVEDGLHLLAFPFIWLAIYAHQDSIAGFDRADIITYYIVLGLIQTLATAHGGERLRMEILRGEINQNLIRPLHHLWWRVMHDAVYHVVLIPISLSFFALIKYLAPNYVRLPTHPSTYLWFILALFLAYFVSSCLEFIIGMCAFWLGNVSGVRQAKQMIELIFSGSMAPLTFFPLVIQKLATLLPFQYIAFVPVQIFLEKLTGIEMAKTFIYFVAWCFGLLTITLLMWNRGLKKYEGVGI